MALITITKLMELGRVSRSTVYKHIRAKKLTFKNGKADPMRLAAEWEKKSDPSQDDDRAGDRARDRSPRANQQTGPEARQGQAESEPEPPESEESYWAVAMRMNRVS